MTELVDHRNLEAGFNEPSMSYVEDPYTLSNKTQSAVVNAMKESPERDDVILIGGTPYPPTLRLLAYPIEAIKRAELTGSNQANLRFVSTADGGASYNFDPKYKRLIDYHTKQKMEMLLFFVEECVPHLYASVLANIDEIAPFPEGVYTNLWQAALDSNQEKANGYLEYARSLGGYQSVDKSGEYGARHALWAGDIIFQEQESFITPEKTVFTHGGQNETQFNLARIATRGVPIETLKEILREDVIVREKIFHVIDNWRTPVPYGLATKNQGGTKPKEMLLHSDWKVDSSNVEHWAGTGGTMTFNAEEPKIKANGGPLNNELEHLRAFVEARGNSLEDLVTEAAKRFKPNNTIYTGL